MFKIQYIWVTVFVITCICVTKCETQPIAVSPQVQYCVTPHRNMSIYANLVEATQRYRMTIAIDNTYFITMSAMAVLGNLWVKLVKIG